MELERGRSADLVRGGELLVAHHHAPFTFALVAVEDLDAVGMGTRRNLEVTAPGPELAHDDLDWN